MKKTSHWMCISSLLLLFSCYLPTGCRDTDKQSTTDIIIVDTNNNYPKNELILQDLMNVEYIPLETTDEFLTQGIVLAIGKDILLIRNQINDGTIFVFDRNGKGLRTINRRGQGGEEYSFLWDIMSDDENNELFINSSGKILVYDLFGKFKRSLPYKEGASYENISNFDQHSIICNDNSFTSKDTIKNAPFAIISKQDGSILKEISVSSQRVIEEKRINHNDMVLVSFGKIFPDSPITKFHENWLLTVYSNDTVFRYSRDHKLTPFMVRTPSKESNNAEYFISSISFTDRYFFIQAEKSEPEAKGDNPRNAYLFYPKKYLMYDRQEKKIYENTVYNADFSSQKMVRMFQHNTGDSEIAFWTKIDAYELVDAYEKGQLKGKLEEIASKLDAEDNPVIMLVKYKK
jgi:hypothetical protein